MAISNLPGCKGVNQWDDVDIRRIRAQFYDMGAQPLSMRPSPKARAAVPFFLEGSVLLADGVYSVRFG